MACFFVIVFSTLGIYRLVKDISSNIKAEENILETNANVQIYKENNTNIQIYNEPSDDEVKDKSFTVAFLGELMMGGSIGEELNYNYMSAFKNISEYTSKADYTVVNLATNIIDLKKIKDAKSEYIVTKNIENAFSALGVDGINLASDHMLDFGESVFKDTVKILQKDYDLIGLKDTTVYVEHDGIKIGIIGVCNEVIGTEGKYTDAGIMMYNLKNLKSMIKEAKKKVNTVVLLTHLGLENTHTVTSIMSWFYKELIDAGADIVLGSHALGLYPVEIYNGKPIIYSMSNLMSNSDYLLGRESGIFTLNINKDGKLEKIEILPLYVNAKKQTLIYSAYNKQTSNKLLQYLSQNLDSQKYTINDNKLVITLK